MKAIVERKAGVTLVKLPNYTIRTTLINRHAYNRLRKLAATGELNIWHINGAMRSKQISKDKYSSL